MRDERRPGQDAPANITTAPRLAGSGPVEEVLGRLDKVRRSGKGWIARCPAHEDRFPSLSIAEGRDGRCLLCCHAGCRNEEVTAALGITLADLFSPEETRPFTPRPSRRPKRPITLPRSVAEIMVESGEFAFMWEAAKALAAIEPRQARTDVVAAWPYIIDRCDPELLMQTAYMLRGIARLTYCTPRNAADYKAVQAAVKRLIADLEEVAA